MISRREVNLDRNVLLTLRDPFYIAQRQQAWRRCLLAADFQPPAAGPWDYWTPEWERRQVAEAEAECRRTRELLHAMRMQELAAMDLAAMRKPPAVEREDRQKIRRVK